MRIRIREAPSAKKTEDTDIVKALKSANITMALQAVVMSVLFLLPSTTFQRPVSPPDPWWLSVAFGGVEIWDFVFPVVAVLLFASNWKLKRMTLAHIVAFGAWFSLGVLWMVGDLLLGQQNYLFVAGLFSLFVSALHLSVIRGWRAEGVH